MDTDETENDNLKNTLKNEMEEKILKMHGRINNVEFQLKLIKRWAIVSVALGAINLAVKLNDPTNFANNYLLSKETTQPKP